MARGASLLKHAETMGQLQNCPICLKNFSICHSCYRGQKYCSVLCRRSARAAQINRASQRCQKSENGKYKHRLRQLAYRKRKKSVTHQSSQLIQKSVVLPVSASTPMVKPSVESLLKCIFCGKKILFFMNEPVCNPATYLRRTKNKRKRIRDHDRTEGRDPPEISR